MSVSADILFRFFTEIGSIAQRGQTVFERVLPGGMTLAQFVVLDHLSALDEARKPGDLARNFQVTKATMSSTLQRLARKGLVDLAQDAADGRAKNVTLTRQGRAMREACLAALKPELARLAPLLAEGDIDALLPWISDIRAAMEQAGD